MPEPAARPGRTSSADRPCNRTAALRPAMLCAGAWPQPVRGDVGQRTAPCLARHGDAPGAIAGQEVPYHSACGCQGASRRLAGTPDRPAPAGRSCPILPARIWFRGSMHAERSKPAAAIMFSPLLRRSRRDVEPGGIQFASARQTRTESRLTWPPRPPTRQRSSRLQQRAQTRPASGSTRPIKRSGSRLGGRFLRAEVRCSLKSLLPRRPSLWKTRRPGKIAGLVLRSLGTSWSAFLAFGLPANTPNFLRRPT